MLFNSYIFMFAYLPTVIAGFFVAGRMSRVAGAVWLTAASVVFYSWWDWHFTFLLLSSVAFNFFCGKALAQQVSGQSRASGPLLMCGIAVNLIALGYFKYANFFVANASALLHVQVDWPAVVLPIGISFFTFTQIAFLVDVQQGKVTSINFVHYLLFVTYFPHLIAGPILHHAEMIPQFRSAATYVPREEPVAVGLTVFLIGLFKKVVLADSVGSYANFAFSPERSHAPSLVGAWTGALAYTLQIYFDFSAYCDMAIGMSRMLNIRLPVNFESPYKACSVIDFWRRWHMTLSRFLRDYLYIPLGGNRHGNVRRYANLLITMALGGLWHGAGWTFVVWGGLHGLYLVVNHGWRYVRGATKLSKAQTGIITRGTAWGLTFMSVVVAWVFFRSPDLTTAISMVEGMAGLNGVVMNGMNDVYGLHGLAWITGLLAVALLAPNLRQLMSDHDLVLDAPRRDGDAALSLLPTSWIRWSPSMLWMCGVFAAFVVALMHMTRISQFLYFQF